MYFKESQWPQGAWPGLASQIVRNKGRDLARELIPPSPPRAAGVLSAAQMGVLLPYFILRFFIYLMEREHKEGERQAEGGGEACSLLSKEPDEGLDPRTQGS